MDLDKFLKELNSLLESLDEKYDINSGGCCCTAYFVAKNLEKLGIRYKLVIHDRYYGDLFKDFTKLQYRKALKDRDPESALVYKTYNHYYLRVGNTYINGDAEDSDLELGCIPSEVIKTMYDHGDWNDFYDTAYNNKINSLISKFFKKMAKANLKDVLTVTLTGSKSGVKNLTDKQLTALAEKLTKLSGIVAKETEFRNKKLAEQACMDDVDASIEEDIASYAV